MRRSVVAALAVLAAGAAALLPAPAASAHVVPSTVIALDVHDSDITATVTLPESDLATASGVDVGDVLDDSEAAALEAYLEDHFAVASDDGAWTVDATAVELGSTEQWGTGAFDTVTATVLLTPADASEVRAFTLEYDAIVHQVVTADVSVILHSDWAAGELESARDLGTISADTVTGGVSPLAIDLDDGSWWQGFAGMLGLGVSHIAKGTDHQLFLLTLLLPAPLLAAGGRWRRTAPTRTAVRRIAAITLAFTIGHSITLALGALGLAVAQQPVEVLIAASILVAAVHAIRPLFPGREVVVAGSFGLVHGMAFSATLAALDLSGGQLALSLAGFNLGIELMQLVVVVVVLPPLVVLAGTRAYAPLRVGAAAAAVAAAAGWLLDRAGVPNLVGAAADAIGPASPWIAGALWVAALGVLARRAVAPSPADRGFAHS
ncbi:HupE/UreJ family protein [Agromyces sp. SYSU T00194]|uniref:HupE/UreJ family protein n=1 Tax=Agromyces chitinivorans TaxID=3158560 RepID=UPI003393799A